MEEPGIEKALHVTLTHSAWTLVYSVMEDSSERDSELPVFKIKGYVTVTLMVSFSFSGLF